MKSPLIVLNIVGLSPYMLGVNTPNLNKLVEAGYQAQPLKEVFPAVTTTSQSAMLTGRNANQHGIVGNGWYFKELAEVGFWKQNNGIVNGPKIWDVLKAADPDFKVSQLFWWYNMYANVDYSMTPRPHYLADGGKLFDLYSSPAGLHQSIENDIGVFPFFNFWGPKAGIGASQWIGRAAIEEFKRNRSDLQFVYLPHLDYNLQKFGPNDPKIADDVQAIDAVVGEIFNGLAEFSPTYLVVSEYGITEVNQAVNINQELRKAGYIAVRETCGFENLDCGASKAFAVSDHQCAHIYVNDDAVLEDVCDLVSGLPGVERVLNKQQQKTLNLDHERSGDLVAISNENAWFTYYYWLDENKAPDFARTVDIHRKPGYDPVEMFIDPKIKLPLLKVAGKVLMKKLGFRMLMDVIPLTPELVKGSHGRLVDDPNKGAILILPKSLQEKRPATGEFYHMTEVHDLIQTYFDAS